ncbi:MAG TPA: sugar transferase, partial [Fibrobacteria bacterium]|nr:sugar transferase [Fibrobacteria bacterium]
MKPQAMVEWTKRGMDIVVGLFGTLVFLLAYPLLSLLIKLQSPGPALYNQTRVGRDRRAGMGRLDRRMRDALPPGTERRWRADRRKQDVGGRLFTIHKFRTMRLDAEKAGPQLCGKGGDPRVTRIGNLLRKLHLDELPQFWSVLKGDMSFIGPRPERPHFTVQYAEKIPGFALRTRGMKPGILGLAQIVNGYDDGLESVVRKTHFDLAYGASMTDFGAWIRMETWILVNTFLYYATGRPLAEAGRLPHFVPALRPHAQTPAAVPAAAAPEVPAAVSPATPTAARIDAVAAAGDAILYAPPAALDSLGADVRRAPEGLAVAMVRHHGTMKPTLVFVKPGPQEEQIPTRVP